MLTPIDIQGKIFKSGMGYNKADVDSFFLSMSADYETLYRENLSLKERINNLTESLNHYREIEKSLQKALVLAETTAEETIVSAKKNATVIEQEAILKAQTIVADAKVELDRIHVQTTDLLQQYDRYRAQYRALAAAQLAVLDSDAFDIELATLNALSGLSEDASGRAEKFQAEPVHAVPNNSYAFQTEAIAADEQESFDEALSTDDSMIRDFSEMFKNESNS